MCKIPSPLRSIFSVLFIVAIAGVADPLRAAELKIVLPLARTAYQTNEWIDLTVVRQAPQALGAGELTLSVEGDDGSQLRFSFDVPAATVVGKDALRTEHLQLAGWLLRPGHYSIAVSADGATAKTALDLFSHIRKTSYRLISWGQAKGAAQLAEGEDNLGFNLFYGGYGNDQEANFIRAGVDYMSCCTMGGGHQMDLRAECDWSDPYVTRGGTQRVVRRAFIDRTRPNVPGVHFFDEPGLTWFKHPVTGEMTPHQLPSQVRSFRAAFGHDPLPYYQVKADQPDHAAQWRQWATWKLSFIDAAWKEAQFGVSYVRPDFLSVTQSQYGFSAFTDGYYFNVARSLPIVSGHGGYDDYGLGYFNPSYFLEIARARDFQKPCWYLPTWYGSTPSERFRLEQYLSFMTNIQGMISPPEIDPFEPEKRPAAEGVVEANKLMARLGTVFTTMPVTRPPVAMLYGMTQNIAVQTRDMKANYAHANKQGLRLPFTYMAGKILQQQFLPVVEEDLIDGTLATHHKAVVLTAIDYLDPKAVKALEAFATTGGLVLLTGDSNIQIAGAIRLGVVGDWPDAELVNKLHEQGKHDEANKHSTVGHLMAGARPLAEALRPHLAKAGIEPVFVCDQPGIAATRQTAGDVEYLFAVNAAYNPVEGGMNSIRATEASLGIADDGRPVYDALLGGPAATFVKKNGKVIGRFRFGPGQMRVFARTARPIGKVEALPPQVARDLTKADAPMVVNLGAVVLDTQGRILSGSIPLEVQVIDPLGGMRYNLYRATERGTFQIALPLAANDPAGQWRVVIRELLENTEEMATFDLAATRQCGAMAGVKPRAVVYGNDRDNVFRFFRTHHDVTLVLGKGGYNEPAARRLAESLRPWGVTSKIVKAADINRPRELSAEEAATWTGIEFGRVKPGKENDPGHVGFDIAGPVVLLGTPQDNPLIEFIHKQGFLPYAPTADVFPGRGRGMMAWQRDAIGKGQESITLLAYDAEGMGEAVGTLYEATAGLDPLTRLELPTQNSIEPARAAKRPPSAATVWQAALPDRALAMKVVGPDRLQVITWDGSLFEIDSAGKIVRQQAIAPQDLAQRVKSLQAAPDAKTLESAKKAALPGRLAKMAVAGTNRVAVGYWGGLLETRNAAGEIQTSQQFPQDITVLCWMGNRLIIGLADGRILATTP